MTSSPDVPWRVVVPVKEALAAKSRLHPPPGVDRPTLARAFALDALDAVSGCIAAGDLLVVSSDTEVRRWCAEIGAGCLPDLGEGLNAAVRSGLRKLAQSEPVARARRPAQAGDPAPTRPVAVLLGDLPCLDSPALAEALDACARHTRSFVPDAEGEGTVLLAALNVVLLDPRFGPGSARRHEQAGHTRLDLELPRLRRDVDDDRALAAARRIGVGRRTRQALQAASRH